MGCHAGAYCTPKICEGVPHLFETHKTGPRPLAPGFNYEDCTLLQLAEDGLSYEPLSVPDPALIKGWLGCGVDLTDAVAPCSVGVHLQACVNLDTVAWPEKFTDEDIEAIRICSNCCIVFESLVCCTPEEKTALEAKAEKIIAKVDVEV